jgi:dienelactone hydrolase
MTTPAIAGFDQAPFTHQGRTYPVYRAGTGPAVIIIHEIPGIHPGMITFAQRLLEAGYTVYMPSLFGRPGEPFGAGPLLRSVLRVCVSREFALWPTGPAQSRPGCVHWPPPPTASVAVPGWARSACV